MTKLLLAFSLMLAVVWLLIQRNWLLAILLYTAAGGIVWAHDARLPVLDKPLMRGSFYWIAWPVRLVLATLESISRYSSPDRFVICPGEISKQIRENENDESHRQTFSNRTAAIDAAKKLAARQNCFFLVMDTAKFVSDPTLGNKVLTWVVRPDGTISKLYPFTIPRR